MTVSRILRVSLTTADLKQAETFYCQTFGFSRVNSPMALDRSRLDLMGVPSGTAQAVSLRLGSQELELVAFDPPGQPYPAECAADDPWFQHVAIVVSDMPAAWERVRHAGIRPISRGGPQQLPPNTGSVTAVKFRDPEGHPLELLQFPPGTGDPGWQQGGQNALFLGYDHSAIVVRDVAASIRFYSGMLGFTEMARSLNQGAEQARLDGLPGDTVDVVALRAHDAATPHLELLGYRRAGRGPASGSVSPRDVAATRLILEADDPAAVIGGPAAADADGRRMAGTVDPDGHRLLLVGRS